MDVVIAKLRRSWTKTLVHGMANKLLSSCRMIQGKSSASAAS